MVSFISTKHKGESSMYKEALKYKVYEKLEYALKIYEQKIFVKIGELQNAMGFYTKEHLRSVPEIGWEKLNLGSQWGFEEWDNLWVKGTYECDEKYEGKDLYAVSNAGGVEELFFIDKKPMGLFNSKHRDHIGGNHSARKIGKAEKGKRWELAFECYAGHICVGASPFGDRTHALDVDVQTYSGVDICIIDEAVRDLVFDLVALIQAYQNGAETNFLKFRAMHALDKVSMILILDPESVPYETWHKAVEDSLAITRKMFEGKGNSIFGRYYITGHSHMDTAWLWPVSETIRKCARTYSNAMALMDEYPEYRFVQSSALHSEWMKDYYPSIFEDMKKRVKEGRYEPNGGVYVECDCNITSGELMIRQFLKGQQFTREHFDYTSDSFWLPDTFGYNANIPQIMLGCGVKYFYTTKLSWNEMNKVPYYSFTWKGIDGSSVLTHYNRIHIAPDVKAAITLVNEIPMKETTDMRLHSYGFGDGGGGPSYGMLEAAKRVKKLDGMPETKETSVSEFMHELEKTQDELPVYDGELYLELHRGTLTQMHDVKRKNRKAEFALHDMEYFNVLSNEKRNENADRWLKILLTNQFHDILPGTCITPVYETFNKEMDELLINYRSSTHDYANKLTDDSEKCVTLFNTLSFARHDVQKTENISGYAENLPSQRYIDVCGREILAIGGTEIPAFASKAVTLSDKPMKTESPFKFDGKVLETPFAIITLTDDGYIGSFIDKETSRELKKENTLPLGTLYTAEDIPNYWDNWDLDFDAIEKLTPITGFKKREIITDGALMFILRSTFKFGTSSCITQDMIVYADSARVDFHTLVDWNEIHTVLKAGFDVDIRSTTVKNEIQFGNVDRPTTKNNSLEVAKFEVCNYKWTDISEPNFGVALLNDCKYGISVENGNLRLTLHRGGNHPDVTGDKGLHEMTYSLLPHSGAFSSKSVVKPSYELNVPTVYTEGAAEMESFLTVDKDNIICETVKPAENRENAYVIRLYECEGAKTNAAVTLSRGNEVISCNMIEDEADAVKFENGKISLTFKPFEIKTFLIK